jgi:hypothetical protein
MLADYFNERNTKGESDRKNESKNICRHANKSVIINAKRETESNVIIIFILII